MAETPFEPFFDGGKDARPRGARNGPRAYGRSFRCRAALHRPQPEQRFAGFVALHEYIDERHTPNLRHLWVSGLLTAVGAGGVAALVVLLLRGTFGLAVPAFLAAGTEPVPAAAAYGVCAGAATLQATALLHVLLATAARPVRAFCWIGGLVVMLLTLLPLTLHAPTDAVLVTSGLNAVGGAAVVGLLAALAAASRTWDDLPPFDDFGDRR